MLDDWLRFPIKDGIVRIQYEKWSRYDQGAALITKEDVDMILENLKLARQCITNPYDYLKVKVKKEELK